MKVYVRDKKDLDGDGKVLVVETRRLTLVLPDVAEFDLFAVEDSSPPRQGKGLVIMASGENTRRRGISVWPDTTNVVIIDID